MKYNALLVPGLLLIVLAWGCYTDDSGTSSPTGPAGNPTPNYATTFDYVVQGDSLLIFYPETIDTSRRCNGDTLVVDIDTAAPDTTISRFEVSRDTLVLHVAEPDSFASDSSLAAVLYSRIGTGAGLHGTWKPVVLVRADGERVELESLQESAVYEFIAGMTMTIDESGIHTNGSFELMPGWFTEVMMFQLTWGLTGWMYDISDTVVADSQIVLTGNKTGETVTVTFYGEGDARYTSDDPAHEPGIVYDEPTTCPNDPPDWYSDFLSGNSHLSKSANATRQLSGRPGGHIVPTLLLRLAGVRQPGG